VLIFFLCGISLYWYIRSSYLSFSQNELRKSITVQVKDDTAPFPLVTSEIPYKQELSFTHENIASVDHKVLSDVVEFAVSPDGTRAGLAQYDSRTGTYVFIDNVVIGPVSIFSRLTFSSDSNIFSFIVSGDHYPYGIGSRQYVVVRGEDKYRVSPPLKQGDQYYGSSKSFPVTDYPEFYGIDAPFRLNENTSFTTSIDQQINGRVEIVHRCGDAGGEGFCIPTTSRIVVNDKGKVYKHKLIESGVLGSLALSPDGKKIAYASGILDADSVYVVVSSIDGTDSTTGGKWDGIAIGSIRFSDNGKYVGYGAQRGGKLYWVVEKIN